ncbi:VOC family protein [Pseudidiomarina terrestris]|uniref:VOC family protein n=1 Tax=Pseudidiomarina terrestris TaxID=2820060 RepID=UPI00264B9976|nr:MULTISPECIES: VOC family protein [unclassified Pseudidiomarina]MDN7134895.1 VOC family protein [Pseudidiomarina sp. 1ASP75-5]MEA3587317.1 VOC family protein [Pseudidiomarina sp. 1APP75-27a]
MASVSINYIELPASDIEGTKKFFTEAFGWSFVDYGPDYASIQGAGLDGGFYRSKLTATTAQGSALVVLYSSALEQAQHQVEKAGGTIVKPIFEFPGGRRFHFTCPSSNEYAIWSE